MRVCVYEAREDERRDFERMSAELGLDVRLYSQAPSLVNASLAEGCRGVAILGQGKIDGALLDAWWDRGVRYLATRTVGYNHIDLEHARAIGMKVCCSDYAPNGVADYTVMMILLVLRNYKPALWRGEVNDYSLRGLQGRELKDLTIGVIGTGRIGSVVVKNLSGFGCRILAWNRRRDPEVEKYAEYMDLERLYAESDVITLHLPLTEDTWHFVRRDTIAQMKDGVVLINCARGELMDLDDLIEGIETRKIGGLGVDTVEGENGLVHEDHRTDILKNKNIAYLRQFPNVVMTQHMAFYTDAAVSSMVRSALEGIVGMAHDGHYKTQLV